MFGHRDRTNLKRKKRKKKKKKERIIMQDIECLSFTHELFTRVTLSEPLEVEEKYCLPASNRHHKSSLYLPNVTS